MKVHFKRGWFGPDLTRYRKSVNKHDLREVPDELRKSLPSTATVIEKPEAAPVAPKETLRDHDTERRDQDELARRLAEREASSKKRK